MLSGYFEFNSGKIYYETTGAEKPGIPLVLIHGFSLDLRSWKPQITNLSPFFKIISYDARGFGRSSIPKSPYSHHEDLRALLNYLNIPKVNLVGFSMGGRIATNFTISYPQLINKLALFDSSLDGYESTVDWDVLAKSQGIVKAKANWLNHQLFIPAKKHPEVMSMITTMVSEYSGWHWLNSELEIPMQDKSIERLNEVKAPTLVGIGQHDLPYFHDIAQTLASGIKNSKRMVVSGAGHMVNLENPELFNELILEHFLQN